MSLHTFRIVKSCCVLAFTLALVVPALLLWPVANRISIASGQLLDCTVTIDGQTNGNPACLQSQLLAITGSVRATMGAVAKAAPEVTASIKTASSNSVDASKATASTARNANALLIEAQGAIVELHSVLTDLHVSLNDLTRDAGRLLESSDDTVAKAGVAMVQMTLLEKTLDVQIAEQSPEIGRTLKAMSALLEDPALKDTLAHIDGTSANVEQGTKHLAETAETVDIATRDLRKKAGQVKWLIDKALGMIKVTLPLF